MLVSPDFMASDYCYSKEVTRAIERHSQKDARVIPVILRHAQWKNSPIGKLQAVPTDGKPVRSWQDEDEAFFNVVEGIRKAIEELTVQASSSGTAPAVTSVQETGSPNFEPTETSVVDALPKATSPSSIEETQGSPSSIEPSQNSSLSPLFQEKDELQENLIKLRNRLANIEEILDLGATNKFTEDFAVEVHHLLREAISTIRRMPSQTPIKYFESKDNLLENLRQARIQAMMAINSLPTLLMRDILNNRKPETFYQCLMSCREYLERALSHW